MQVLFKDAISRQVVPSYRKLGNFLEKEYQSIKYMMENETISEQGAIAEIERYMAIPGQALSYKIGALKIRELETGIRNQWAISSC